MKYISLILLILSLAACNRSWSLHTVEDERLIYKKAGKKNIIINKEKRITEIK